MPKIFDRQFEGKYQPKRINEDLWFRQQQKLLLFMANTDYGRDLLCIDKRLPKIIKMRKNSVTGLLDIKKIGRLHYVQKVSDFRTGVKWANVVRYRWEEFQQYAQVYYEQMHRFGFKMPSLWPVAPVPGFNYTHTTYFPAAGSVSPADGFTRHNNSGTWATARDAADGTSVNMTADLFTRTGLAGGLYDIIRVNTLFDTADIADGDTITAATYSQYVVGVSDSDNDGNDYIAVVTCSPASNSSFVTDDYDQYVTTEQHATGQRKDLTGQGTGAYLDWTLNATGLASISKTGITKFATREGHDLQNDPVAAGTNELQSSSADTAGTTQDPKLAVTHSAVAAAVSISNLLLMGV